MTTRPRHLLRYLRKRPAQSGADLASDATLLGRFISSRDDEAFAALVDRHGPMVLRVCRRILNNTHDADDAFQATFLVLDCDLSSLLVGLIQKARAGLNRLILKCRQNVGAGIDGQFHSRVDARSHQSVHRLHKKGLQTGRGK